MSKVISPAAPCPYDTRCPPCTEPIAKGDDAVQVYHFYMHARCAADLDAALLEWDPEYMAREHKKRVLRMGLGRMRELLADGVINQIEYDLHLEAWARCTRWERFKAWWRRG